MTQTPSTKTTQRISLPEALQLAFQHHAAGRAGQAETLLRKILQAEAKNSAALHLLGVVTHQEGKTELAAQLIEQAIQVQPKAAQYHANLGEMYRILKQLDKAEHHGQQAVNLDPNMASAHSNLGIVYYDLGDMEQAESCQKRALELEPKLVSALNNLGSIRRDQKDKGGAIAYYHQVLAIDPGHLESINNLGAVLTEDERPEEAIKVLLKAIQAKPDYADAHCNIATAFLALEQFDKATAGFNRALELRAEYPEAFLGMARIHQEHKRLDEAEAMADKALAADPDKAEAHSMRGSLFAESGYPDKAEQAFARALELNPELISAYLGRGHLRMEQGKMAEAEADFRYALGLDESNLGARLSLTQVKKVKEDDENMAALVAEADKLDSMLETKAIPLNFALGKSYDDTKQYDLAFKHYREGCRLKHKRINYSADDNDLSGKNVCEFFSRENIEGLSGEGCPSELPIFVLGMPRSGTTLTEQIIASHPLVHGAGELPDLLGLAARPFGEETAGYPKSLQGISQTEFKILGERYVKGLQERAPDSPRITDKMPANFNCVGLIHLMLPNAKIVHVKRNPVDTCLSCFTRLFNKSQFQSYDLTDIGRYYHNYGQLMTHWREVLPEGSFYEVQYEELVADTEGQARALIDYCGLEWDEACLEFHKNKRSIRTASITQVRQPIYKSSVERWRNYEKHLDELLKALGEFAPEF